MQATDTNTPIVGDWWVVQSHGRPVRMRCECDLGNDTWVFSEGIDGISDVVRGEHLIRPANDAPSWLFDTLLLGAVAMVVCAVVFLAR